eukprot:3440207-Ditylum_brightwellii.AAC.1
MIDRIQRSNAVVENVKVQYKSADDIPSIRNDSSAYDTTESSYKHPISSIQCNSGKWNKK